MISIYIPTLGRLEKQTTWNQLPTDLQLHTSLVCQPEEKSRHIEQARNVLVCKEKGIANVRQWLCDYRGLQAGEKKIIMTDDDQYFYRRVRITEPALRKCEEKDMFDMFDMIEKLLDDYPLVGVSSRQGNDAYLGIRVGARKNYERQPGLAFNKRTCNMYGVRTDILHQHGIRFNEVQLMEDMNVTLSLIKLGYDIPLVTEFAWNQESSGVKGGCSSYRNFETQKQAAIKLAELHKPFVTVIKKKSKDKSDLNWKSVGKERFDVRVDWTSAVAAGKQSNTPGFL